MTFAALVERYQAYDPATGKFTLRRTDAEFAALLDVDPALVAHLRGGRIKWSMAIARGLARAFPAVRDELFAVLAGPEEAHVAV